MARHLGHWPDGSPEWHEARRTRIGGSDIATVCGWSPYETANQLLARKLGLAPEKPYSKAMHRGHILEPAIAAWLADVHGLSADPALNGTYVDDDHDGFAYNPDGITSDGILLEFKTTSDRSRDNGWNRAGTDQIPLHYQAQVTWGMGLLGIRECVLAVLAGAVNGRPDLHFQRYKITFHQGAYDHMVAKATEFHQRMTHHELQGAA